MDGLFLNQNTNKNIRISYSLKYKYSKKKILSEKINDSVGWNKKIIFNELFLTLHFLIFPSSYLFLSFLLLKIISLVEKA